MDEEQRNRLSRRQFFKVGALAGAGVAAAGLLSGCSNNAEAADEGNWDREADVVVLGFGGAGAAAAIEAADAGAKVLLLDRAERLGGASGINGGVVQAAGSSVQKAAGFEDSPADWVEYLTVACDGGGVPELQKAMAEMSAENIDWLIDLGGEIPAEVHQTDTRAIPESGLYYSDASIELFPAKPIRPRGHVIAGHGPGFAEALSKGVEERGVETLLKTPAKSLVQSSDGTVIGVIAEGDDGEIRIKANKAVVIATGHFTMNKEMLAVYAPGAVDKLPSSNPEAFGDGHRMAAEIGAALANMGNGTCYQMSGVYEAGIRAMYVNKFAQRYWNEQGYHENFRGTVLSRQPGQIGFAIFDEPLRAQFNEMEPDKIKFKGNTIEELAGAIGMNPKALRSAVDEYNSFAAAGEDPKFGKAAQFLVPIKTAPFYALPQSYVYMTGGGIRINEKAQAIDVNGEVIPRLYAAGMCSYGAYGYLNPGSGINMAWNFYTGRTAGKNAAAEAARS